MGAQHTRKLTKIIGGTLGHCVGNQHKDSGRVSAEERCALPVSTPRGFGDCRTKKLRKIYMQNLTLVVGFREAAESSSQKLFVFFRKITHSGVFRHILFGHPRIGVISYFCLSV